MINNLIWCKKNKKIPIVFWGKQSLYFEPQKGDNVWEYYFSQVSTTQYQTQMKIYNGYLAPDHTGIQCHHHPNFLKITKEYRQLINNIIHEYIILKPEINEKINKFYALHMRGKKTVGIHIRGTDKYKEDKPVDINNFIEKANAYDCDQFLIASDEQIIFDKLIKNLNKKVIYLDAHRSINGRPLHFGNFSKYELGEEVLVEALLLSECDTFIHAASNVSLAVLFFNPNLENVYLSPEK